MDALHSSFCVAEEEFGRIAGREKRARKGRQARRRAGRQRGTITTYAWRDPSPRHDVALFDHNLARQALRHWRVHAQRLVEHREHVLEPADAEQIDLGVSREGAAHLGDRLGEDGRVAQQVVGDAVEQGGRRLAAGDDER